MEKIEYFEGFNEGKRIGRKELIEEINKILENNEYIPTLKMIADLINKD